MTYLNHLCVTARGWLNTQHNGLLADKCGLTKTSGLATCTAVSQTHNKHFNCNKFLILAFENYC